MEDAIASLRIEDPALAGRLISALTTASSALAYSVPSVEEDVAPDLRRQIARAIGTVMGMDLHDLLMVILRQHPQLDVHGLLSEGAAGG